MGSSIESKEKPAQRLLVGLWRNSEVLQRLAAVVVLGRSLVSALRKGGAGLDQLQQPLHESFAFVDARGTCSAGLWRPLTQVH